MPNVLALILIEPKMLGEATHIGLNHPHRNLEAGRMSIETRFDVPLIAAMALKEKQIQQNYRPIIAVHKWFARRPGTLFRGLILSEFGDRPLAECFFEANDFPGRIVADPFMGGGTPLIEANRVGCDVLGFDINPMAAWIVREEIEHLDLGRLSRGRRCVSLKRWSRISARSIAPTARSTATGMCR